ncbi:MAG: hypothetical protein M3O41_14305 [Pseudomonadota bacterium]|nr:hypothetical protein [Pseudomonadota bacterium]
MSELSERDKGRIAGAFEARGGVVISKGAAARSESSDALYFGVRLYIETLTVNEPLNAIFGPPSARAAYARPVYRYEVTKREDVLRIAEMILANVFSKDRKSELRCAIEFCMARDNKGREAAATALADVRASVSQ